jgi:hypothetical protein
MSSRSRSRLTFALTFTAATSEWPGINARVVPGGDDDDRGLVGDDRRPTTDHRPPVTEHRRPVTDGR